MVGRDSAAGVLSPHLSSRCGRYSSDWPSLWPEMDYLDQASGHKQVQAKLFFFRFLGIKRIIVKGGWWPPGGLGAKISLILITRA